MAAMKAEMLVGTWADEKAASTAARMVAELDERMAAKKAESTAETLVVSRVDCWAV